MSPDRTLLAGRGRGDEVTRKGEGGGTGFSLGAVLWGLAWAVLLILLVGLAQGLIIALTPWPILSERWVRIVHLIVVGIGGWLAGIRAGRLGWAHGSLVGLIYGIGVAVWSEHGHDLWQTRILLWLLLQVVIGALGGMFGAAWGSGRSDRW
ncbi:MAG: TIGR04086 family membrane protein [Limnochordales bacterium]|nr:TIGR04086 family membrane protein [Limnochordales bacterium]